MTSDNAHFDVVDALLDGDPVTKETLRAALADPDGREYLIDALILRRLAHEMAPNDMVATRSRMGPPLRWVAAAALLTIGAGGGFMYGRRSQTLPVSSLSGDPGAPPAPAATRTIRFEPGVNWTTIAGDH